MEKAGNPVRDVVAERLSILRKSRKLTQRQVAEQINKKYNTDIKQATISSYEQGVTLPPLEMAVILCQFYDTSIDWLCGITKDRKIESEFSSISDVVRTIYNLCVQLPFVSIEEAPVYYINPDGEYIDNDKNPLKIRFAGVVMRDFLSELKRMLDLYDKDVIDKEVLNLWYAKAEDKYNVSIKEWNEPVVPF